jgi:hypothetical protein
MSRNQITSPSFTTNKSFTSLFDGSFFYVETNDIDDIIEVVSEKAKKGRIIKSSTTLGYSYKSIFDSFTFIDGYLFSKLLRYNGIFPIVYSLFFDENETNTFPFLIQPFLLKNNFHKNIVVNNRDVLRKSQKLIEFLVNKNLVVNLDPLLVYHSLIQSQQIPTSDVFFFFFFLVK